MFGFNYGFLSDYTVIISFEFDDKVFCWFIQDIYAEQVGERRLFSC